MVTAAEVRAGLLRHFAQPECAVVFEVAQSTGYNARRHLDAVAMELWPSRGLSLHGIEIKVSRGDWRREKANPAKAEEIARFCDFFWIAAPAGLVPQEELPSAWGLLELDGDTIKQAVAATKTASQQIGRPFLAAVMRAGSRGIDPNSVEAVISRREQQLEAEFSNRVETAAKRRAERGNSDAASWRALVEAIGPIPDTWTGDEHIIEAVRVVLKAGVVQTYSGVRALAKALTEADAKVNEALRGLGIKPEQPKKKRRRAA